MIYKFKDYKIEVLYDEKIFKNISESHKNSIISIIEQDPKPAYKKEEKSYKFLFAEYEITFKIEDKKAIILDIIKK